MAELRRNNELELDVCRYVFKEDPEKYRWGVPFFSTDRNDAAMVNTEIAFREDGTRERYEEELQRLAAKKGWKSEPNRAGISILFMVLLPEEICKAAVTACL